MILFRFIGAIFLAIFLLGSSFGVSEAAPQTIKAVGVAIMGDNDSPKVAREAARQEAMRSAAEKAGVYVESYSKTQHMELTADDVKIISGAVLKITDERDVPELSGDVWKYTVYLTAEVDTDNIDLKAMMAKRTELEKLQKERDDLKKQNEELLAKYRQASGQERTTLETQYTLGEVFDRAVLLIQRGEQKTAIRELSKVIDDDNVFDSPLAYAYSLRGRAYYELRATRLALEDFESAEKTPHNNNIYPIWRTHYYRGLIYSDERDWQRAYDELNLAWDASDKSDDDIWRAMQRADEKAHQKPSNGGGVDWLNVLGAVIAGVQGNR